MTLEHRSGGGRLRVTGLVADPAVLSQDDLADLPGLIADLGDLAEGFTGSAVPAAAVLGAAGPLPEATHCTVSSGDGHYRASIPLGEIIDKGWVAFRLGDGVLPRDRGGPLRVVVVQGRTLCWNVKAAVELRLTAGPEPDSVPANPTH